MIASGSGPGVPIQSQAGWSLSSRSEGGIPCVAKVAEMGRRTIESDEEEKPESKGSEEAQDKG